MVSLMHENVAMNSLECAVNVAELNWYHSNLVFIQAQSADGFLLGGNPYQ